MKTLEVIWFENISAFSENVLGLGPLRVSMKQLLYTFIAIALAMSILNFLKNLILTIALPAFLLILAYARPYGMNTEELLIDMVSFFGRRKKIGVVEEDKEKSSSSKKEEDKKQKQKVSVETPTTEVGTKEIPATTITTSDTVTVVTPPPTTEVTESVEEILPATTTTTKRSNLLHYIVPATKDFNLEITDKEYVIATGESTIHISKDAVTDAIIAIEVRDNAIARIIVNSNSKCIQTETNK